MTAPAHRQALAHTWSWGLSWDRPSAAGHF
jgi:hypothetical protein